MEEKWGKFLKEAKTQIAGYKANNDIAIYTVNFGKYDVVRGPYYYSDQCDYYCITDNDEIYRWPWRTIHVLGGDEDTARLNRLFKFFPHVFLSAYSTSIYLDGNICCIQAPERLLSTFLFGHAISALAHPYRNCAYEEATACIAKNKDKKEAIEGQMLRYRQEGFPANYGLSQNGVIFRDHKNSQLGILMDAWWEEFLSSSKRDQLCLPFVSWKTGIRVSIIPKPAVLATKKITRESVFYYFYHRTGLIKTLGMYRRFLRKLVRAALTDRFPLMDLICHLHLYKQFRRRPRMAGGSCE